MVVDNVHKGNPLWPKRSTSTFNDETLGRRAVGVGASLSSQQSGSFCPSAKAAGHVHDRLTFYSQFISALTCDSSVYSSL